MEQERNEMILFSKYHGCGNSFVILREKELENQQHGMRQRSESVQMAAYGALAEEICDGNTGVGADGLIVVREAPSLEMLFFNRDGSRAPMCGNGIRCFAHYCHQENICRKHVYPVKTLAGVMVVTITGEDPFRVRIRMGKPVFAPEAIGVEAPGENFLGQQLTLEDGTCCQIDSLFMGTVHTVVFVEDFDAVDMEGLGKAICNHPVFREKTNVNFVKWIDEKTLALRTYERGVGMTLACGTGACGSVVVAHRRGLCAAETTVRLPLGQLMIQVDDDGNVFMEGPSAKVADGAFCQKEK